MFIILEHNGTYIMGLMLNKKGEDLIFVTREKANKFAKENCAFEYKIIEIKKYMGGD